MSSQTPPTRVLVILNSLAVGGPQKSLMGMLERIDPLRHDVSLLVLQGERSGPLGPWVPGHVTVIDSSPLHGAATLPKAAAVRSIGLLLRHLGVRHGAGLLLTMLISVLRREPRTRLRQRVWVASRRALPTVPGSFDIAIGILGQSTYAVVDLCTADRKYHWVRSDSRILKRDETIEAGYFHQISGALAVSTSCAEIFEEMYPAMAGRTRVYKNDIPEGPSQDQAEAAYPETHAFAALTIGRLDHLKGIDLAIDACAILRDEGIDLHWVVLGEGSQRESLQAQIADRGLDDRFHLAGNVLNTRPYMSRADVYVHPSRTEGRSNAVEEARAMGKPIVAGNYPTVGDQVEDGVSGIVVPLDPGAIAKTLRSVLEDVNLRAALGGAAKQAYRAEQDDPNDLLDELCTGLPRASSPQQ